MFAHDRGRWSHTMASYTQGFRARMVERMLGSERISAYAVSKETGVNRLTLARWIDDARKIEDMGSKKRSVQENRKQSRQRSAEEKLRLLLTASTLSGEELGAFLRSEGLHEAELMEWRAKSIAALQETNKKPASSPEIRINKELREELLRKDRALAEFAALLALKKKVQEIWGDGDDDTHSRKGT
jgi:transposase-like protein